MAVQLTHPAGGQMAGQTVARLLQSLAGQTSTLEWHLIQCCAPSERPDNTTLLNSLHHIDQLAGRTLLPALYGLLFVFLYWLPFPLNLIFPFLFYFLYRDWQLSSHNNPLVQLNSVQKTLTISQKNRGPAIIVLGRASLIYYREQPAFFSWANKFILIQIHDKDSHAHNLIEIQTAPPFAQTRPDFLLQTEKLAEKLAEKLGISCYFEKIPAKTDK